MVNERLISKFNEKDIYENKRQFVQNLGELLSMTNEDLMSAELENDDLVKLTYLGGGTKLVNIAADSYIGIVRDVAERMR